MEPLMSQTGSPKKKKKGHSSSFGRQISDLFHHPRRAVHSSKYLLAFTTIISIVIQKNINKNQTLGWKYVKKKNPGVTEMNTLTLWEEHELAVPGSMLRHRKWSVIAELINSKSWKHSVLFELCNFVTGGTFLFFVFLQKVFNSLFYTLAHSAGAAG